jgi:hypothetical protein
LLLLRLAHQALLQAVLLLLGPEALLLLVHEALVQLLLVARQSAAPC